MMNTIKRLLDPLAARLPIPTDYFSGYSCFLPILPHDVLAFQRSRSYLDQETPAFHHRFVFIYPIQGQGGVILDGQMCMLSPGYGMLVFPYQSHYFSHLSGERFRWLFLTFALEDFSVLSPLRNRRFAISAAANNRIHEIIQHYLQALTKDRSSAEVIALHIALLLHEVMASHAACPHELVTITERVDEKHVLAGKASQCVYRNIATPLSPGDVAGELRISESYLRAQFKQTVGISLGKFIRQAKIFTACTLLRTTTLLVTDIATQCGYDSLYAFSRAFRHVMQVSPQQYRKQTMDASMNGGHTL